MKVGKAIKKIEKYLGTEVEHDGGRFWFAYEGYVGSFLVNGHHGDDVMEAEACNWHMRRYDDHSDSMSDYFAGSFRDNLTQLLHSLKAPPCKYNVGQLVRGKQTKRAHRWGFSGLTGMVTKTNSDTVNVQWIGIDHNHCHHLSVRDLELVS
jgi:hypothetical protein